MTDNSTLWQLRTGSCKLRDFLLPQNSVRRKLAGFILNFICGLIKSLRPLNMVCDIIDIYPDSMNISGWAISPNGIDIIDIYFDTILFGSACYGQERPDVEKVFPHIKDSRYSGFQFNQKLHKVYRAGSNHTVKIIGRDKKGITKELLISSITKESILPRINKNSYEEWINRNEPQEHDLELQSNITFNYKPKINIIASIYNTSCQFVIAMIESVIDQTYSNWELCIIESHITEHYRKILLEYYKNKDKRIKVKLQTENKGSSGNLNEALLPGDFIILLNNNYVLAPSALFEIVKVINDHSNADFIYSDEDKISEDGKRLEPHFKPDWSPDTLRSYNYAGHISVFRKDLIEQIRAGFESNDAYDLILRATEKAKEIIHIQKILYHRRYSEVHTETDSHTSAQKALEDHLKRVNIKGKVEKGLLKGTYKTTCAIPEHNKISIIIPNKDHYEYLKRCVDSIIDKSSYRNFEIIIVENGSKEENTLKYYKELKKQENINIIEWHNPFNYSAINNFAVKSSGGNILLFLNNDTEVINSDWLERMVEHVIRKETGAVGAKLYYPDDTIQHGGVIIGLHGAAMHAHRHFHKNEAGYNSRLMIIQNLSAVTAACLMMRKEAFIEIGGFDTRYSIAFNDVDLCLKLREKNYLIVWTPYAELYHYESRTRGLDDTPEKQEIAKKEVELLKSKWKEIFQKGDPYYNPNLTLDKEDFSFKRVSII